MQHCLLLNLEVHVTCSWHAKYTYGDALNRLAGLYHRSSNVVECVLQVMCCWTA